MTMISRPASLAEQARRCIKEAIRDGVIVPGQFYSEQSVADVLSISRTPVREAVLELTRAGLLEVLPQRGFRVREITPAEREEVFELRTLLEGHVVRKLSSTIDDSTVRELETLLEEQKRLSSNLPRFLDKDEEFHLRIVELAGFRKARAFLLELRGTIWLLGLTALSRPSRVTAVLEEHAAIVAALARRDADGAVRATVHHLQSTRDSIEAALASREDGPPAVRASPST